MEIADIREKAHHVCADYLQGIWATLQPDDIIIAKIHGGFINYMFKLSLPPDCNPIGEEPRQVLMKLFTDNLKIGKFGMMIENVVVTVLDGEKIAPKVYGVFDGGRLDEFIEGRNLLSKDFEDQKILETITRKLAHLHCIKLPINKDPLHAYKKYEGILEIGLSSDTANKFLSDSKLKGVYEKFLSLKPKEEYEWLKKVRDASNFPVVFSHNDFHLNNMLMQTTECDSSDLIRFVDWELAGYNHRGNDLSRLLGCFCYDLLPGPPYFKINLDKIPNEEKKKEIFKIYLDEVKKQTNCNLNEEEEILQLLKEVQLFQMYGNFLGILFTLFNPFEMVAKLDLSALTEPTFRAYEKEKDNFLKFGMKND